MTDEPDVSDADIAFGAILAFEELVRLLAKAKIINAAALAKAIHGRAGEFSDPKFDAGLVRMLHTIADIVDSKGTH